MSGISLSSVVALDADDAERALHRYFPSIRFTRSGASGLRARVATASAAVFNVVDYGFDGRGGGISNTDDFTVVHSRGRDYTLNHGRAEIPSAEAFLAPRDGLAGQWTTVACVAIGLDPIALGAVARASSGRDDLRLRRTGFAPKDVSALAHWSATVADLRRTIAVAPELFDEPLIERATFDQLATAFLHAFPTNWLDGSEHTTPSIDASAVVRRALDYLYAHASEAITTTDIADAAFISARGLRAAFARELGLTPQQVLRHARLDGVRADLKSSAPGSSVASIARRWGFANGSRFAAGYEARFGEHPRETTRG